MQHLTAHKRKTHYAHVLQFDQKKDEISHSDVQHTLFCCMALSSFSRQWEYYWKHHSLENLSDKMKLVLNSSTILFHFFLPLNIFLRFMFGKKNLKICVESCLGSWFLKLPLVKGIIYSPSWNFSKHLTPSLFFSTDLSLIQFFSCCLPNYEVPKVIRSFAANWGSTKACPYASPELCNI